MCPIRILGTIEIRIGIGSDLKRKKCCLHEMGAKIPQDQTETRYKISDVGQRDLIGGMTDQHGDIM